jgi:hypothetical protein
MDEEKNTDKLMLFKTGNTRVSVKRNDFNIDILISILNSLKEKKDEKNLK